VHGRRIKRLTYQTGFIERLTDARSLPAIGFDAAELPTDLLDLFDRTALLNLAGQYGDPYIRDPIQYDHLRIEHEKGVTEVTVYNRAILLSRTNIEAIKGIHQVCCRLDDLSRQRHRA
jgi:hypothetical protein